MEFIGPYRLIGHGKRIRKGESTITTSTSPITMKDKLMTRGFGWWRCVTIRLTSVMECGWVSSLICSLMMGIDCMTTLTAMAGGSGTWAISTRDIAGSGGTLD